MSTVAIIGAGRLGTTLGNMFSKKGHIVRFWDTNPAITTLAPSSKDAVYDAAFVFFCVPSWATREAALNIAPYLKPDTIIISPAKGLEPTTRTTVDSILAETLPYNPAALLIGPMMSEELMCGGHGIALVACKEEKIYRILAALFENTELHVEYASDIHGIALTGVLKSVYATALGISDGLGWSCSIKGWLVAKIIQEMQMALNALDKDHTHAIGTAGIGDLICSGFNATSRQRTTGQEIIQNGAPAHQAEGTTSLPSLVELLKNNLDTLPVLTALKKVILEKHDAKQTFDALLP